MKELGGEELAARAVVKMREACRRSGFKGLTLLGQHCWGPLQRPDERMASIGIDYQFAHHPPTFGKQLREPDYSDAARLIQAQKQWWRTRSRVPHIPTVSVGWDSRPWGSYPSKNRWQLIPEEFHAVCDKARELAMEIYRSVRRNSKTGNVIELHLTSCFP